MSSARKETHALTPLLRLGGGVALRVAWTRLTGFTHLKIPDFSNRLLAYLSEVVSCRLPRPILPMARSLTRIRLCGWPAATFLTGCGTRCVHLVGSGPGHDGGGIGACYQRRQLGCDTPMAWRMNSRFSGGARWTAAIPISRARRITGLSLLNSRSSASVAVSINRLSGLRRR